jgi:hypothetical protein
MKKIISLIFSILLICSFSVPSFATDSSNTSPVVTQFKYTILDPDGNIKSTGVTPDFRTRYTWSGITLENGESVYLQKSDGSNFYALKGTHVRYDITKNRTGRILVYFINVGTADGIGGLVVDEASFTGKEVMRSFDIPEYPTFEDSNYYNLLIQSSASDPLTFTNITLTF